MSIRANPTAIGLFMIGAVVLGIFGVAVLASATWFSKQTTFISYFGESVNGLEVGAPVKFQGVPIGRVTDLLIQIESTDKTFQVPVQYEVDVTRLTSQAGAFVDLDDPAVLRRQIADGLRAQLQMESIVTGQLYIELAYRTDAELAQLETRPGRYPEIPTTPSLLSAFGTQAGSLVGDVLKILFQVNEMLAAVNMDELNRSVVASAQAVERLADSEDVRVAITSVSGMSAQLNSAMGEVHLLAERLGGTIDPLQRQMEATNAEVILTLQGMRQVIEESRGLFTPDGGIGYQMEGAMISLQGAADALRALALSLEQNPDMLLRGRKPDVR